MATVYSLLVGIDNYPAPVASLRGCINDIRAFESVLAGQAQNRRLRVEAQVLLDTQATRDAVIDGFVRHLGQAGEGDIAVFYYSGHGSQEKTPPELLELEYDGLNETLVCVDSREPGHYDLADKELAGLIRHVARRNAHVVVILDCCHSGSGTRGSLNDAALVRQAPTFTGLRGIDTYFIAPGEAAGAGAPLASIWKRPRGRHVVFSACHDFETAKETVGMVPQRGVFSHYLTEALTNSLSQASYRDIFNRVSSRVRATTARQAPLVEAVVSDDMTLPFLGGVLKPQQPYFTLQFDTVRGWSLDGGSVQGVPAPVGQETTTLALFAASDALDAASPLPQPIGSARVTAVFAASSRVEVSLLHDAPDPALTYKGVIVGLPLPPLGVKFSGEAAALEWVRARLAQCGPNGGASLQAAESARGFQLTLLAEADRYRILRAGDDQSLAVDVRDMTATGARQVVKRLEHMARWLRMQDLRNASGRLPAGSVVLEVYRIEAGREILLGSETDPGAAPRLIYSRTDDHYEPQLIKVVIHNRSARRLHCALLDMPGTFGVFSLLEGDTVPVEPGASATAIVGGDTTFKAEIPRELIDQGILQLDDTLKVIASTEEWMPDLLTMPDLDVGLRDRGAADAPIVDTLSRLLSRVQTRHVVPVNKGDTAADWTTAEFTSTIVRPRDEVAIPAVGESQPLASGVTILGHPALRANARLVPDGVPSRDPSRFTAPTPPWLTDHPHSVQPYYFPGTRDDTPALSVLELDEIEDPDAVTVAAPLVIRSEQPLAADETVLPYTFDGEFYVPLGYADSTDGATHIRIVRLPPAGTGSATNPNARSLKGSISIYFKKVLSKYLGTHYPYPLLSVVTSRVGGATAYLTDAEAIRPKVAAAQRILLYIHGIIGDTQVMTASAFTPLDGEAGAISASTRYDLIMAFDYENLNTPIERTGCDLKARLAAVGLGPDHGKVLHVVAHSMGGLVSRWFIEREGGNRVISHLTMVGTPNGGSPWSRYEKWFSTLLSLGLNGLSHIVWPPSVLGSVMHAMTWAAKTAAGQHGQVEVALGEMGVNSEFLESLAASPDPGVPYSIIAGDTSLILQATAGEAGSSRLARLLQVLSPQDLLYRTTALAFFNAPNDIAVAVDAIKTLPAGRALSPVIRNAASDHVSYFGNQPVLKWIAQDE